MTLWKLTIVSIERRQSLFIETGQPVYVIMVILTYFWDSLAETMMKSLASSYEYMYL